MNKKKLILIFIAMVSQTVFAEFSSEDSVSINTTGGNTNLKNYFLSSDNKYIFNKHQFGAKGGYNYGESENIRSLENWNVSVKYSYILTKKLSFFISELIESDNFSGISRRYNSDVGINHTIIKSEGSLLLTEIGYRYSVEKSSYDLTPDKKDNKGRVYLEGHKNIEKNLKAKFWIEYVPNFSESKDWLLSFEPSLIISLNNMFSLKTAYLWKHDNEPAAGKGKRDYSYILSLIGSF